MDSGEHNPNTLAGMGGTRIRKPEGTMFGKRAVSAGGSRSLASTEGLEPKKLTTEVIAAVEDGAGAEPKGDKKKRIGSRIRAPKPPVTSAASEVVYQEHDIKPRDIVGKLNEKDSGMFLVDGDAVVKMLSTADRKALFGRDVRTAFSSKTSAKADLLPSSIVLLKMPAPEISGAAPFLKATRVESGKDLISHESFQVNPVAKGAGDAYVLPVQIIDGHVRQVPGEFLPEVMDSLSSIQLDAEGRPVSTDVQKLTKKTSGKKKASVTLDAKAVSLAGDAAPAASKGFDLKALANSVGARLSSEVNKAGSDLNKHKGDVVAPVAGAMLAAVLSTAGIMEAGKRYDEAIHNPAPNAAEFNKKRATGAVSSGVEPMDSLPNIEPESFYSALRDPVKDAGLGVEVDHVLNVVQANDKGFYDEYEAALIDAVSVYNSENAPLYDRLRAGHTLAFVASMSADDLENPLSVKILDQLQSQLVKINSLDMNGLNEDQLHLIAQIAMDCVEQNERLKNVGAHSELTINVAAYALDELTSLDSPDNSKISKVGQKVIKIADRNNLSIYPEEKPPASFENAPADLRISSMVE